MRQKILKRLLGLAHKNRLETDMDREMRFHIECETEELMKRGMEKEEARLAALNRFGGLEQHKEECRDVARNRWLEDFVQDARYSIRGWFRNPGYTLLAVLTLALGIGANTAIFSVIYGVMLRALPYEHGNNLVILRQQAPFAGVKNLNFSVKEIEDYRNQNQTLDAIAEHHSMNFTLLGGAEPERIQAAVVSANFFELLGVSPIHGRTFLPEDDVSGAEAVLVLSHKYWVKSHAGDPNIVGKVFRMNDRPHTVIGVLPPIPQFPNENDVFMPTSACPTRASQQFQQNRNARMMSVFARMKSHTSIEQTDSDTNAIARHMQEENPTNYPESRGHCATATSMQQELTQQARPTFLLLLGTAGLVLLIACANVANLTLARVMRREREIALRVALGASRRRIIRQLLTESTLLALIGGIFGVFIAAISMNLLISFAARFTPRADEISLNAYVLLFTFLVSVCTGLFFGLMPALSTKPHLQSALKEGSAQSTTSKVRNRLRSLLVVSQVAVSFALLIIAGLMLRSFDKLQNVNLGYNPEKVLVMRVSANWSKYTTSAQFRTFSLGVLEKVQNQPGVVSAAMSNNFPLNSLGIANGGPAYTNFIIEGKPLADNELSPQADFRVISTDYFATLVMPILSGRDFDDKDDQKAPPVAIINQSLARHRFGDDNPLGKRLSFDGGKNWVTVVGVVSDVRQYGLEREPVDEVYMPMPQTFGSGTLLLRTSIEPERLIRQTRAAIHEYDPETAIDRVQTLETARSESLASPRLTTILLLLFASLALIITVAGIAGVMALSVTQRTQELGIRLALGATQKSIMAMVVRQGMTLVLVGLVIGAVIAFQITRVMATLLYAVEPNDPLTFAGVSVVLAIAAALACLVPARRVTRIDPMIALRSQ
jgi:putative ABC transport system permease protein